MIIPALQIATPSDKLLRPSVVQVEEVVTLQEPLLQSAEAHTWTKRVTVTVQSNLASEVVADFPLLLLLTNSNFPFAAGSSDGSDVRFSLRAEPGPSDYLSHELLYYSKVGTSAAFWVNIPSLGHIVDTTLYIFFTGTESAISYTDFSGTWPGFSAVFHTEDSNYTTVPLYVGREVSSDKRSEYCEAIGGNQKGIAAKAFRDDPKNLVNFDLVAAAEPYLFMDAKSSVWEFIDDGGLLEISSSGKPTDSALRSGNNFSFGLRIRDEWTPIVLSMIGWAEPSGAALAGTVTTVVGSSRVRRSGTVLADADDYVPGDGITINPGDADEEVVVVKEKGPLAITGTVCTETGNTAIKGIDTLFTTELVAGDKIQVGDHVLPGTVATITDSNDIVMSLAADVSIGDFDARMWGEIAYVGTSYTIFSIWDPATENNTAKTAVNGNAIIDYSALDFLRWIQYFSTSYGAFSWKNARVQYVQVNGSDVAIANSGTTILDHSGNACTLERMAGGGNKPIENDLGIFNKGMHFDGTGGYLRFNRDLDIGEKSFSLGAWIRPETGSTELTLFGCSRFYVKVTATQIRLAWDHDTIYATQNISGLLTNASEHLIVLVRNKNTNRFYIYVDGVEYLMDTWAGNDIVFSERTEDGGGEPVYIGARATGDGSSYAILDADDFIGTISEIFLTYTPLRASWIASFFREYTALSTYVSLGSLELASTSEPNGVEVELSDGLGTVYVCNN